MLFPSYQSVHRTVSDFIEREKISSRLILEPGKILKLLAKYRFIHFFVTGATGVALNLVTTWLLTRFYFGLDRYFDAYLIGLSLNIFYNFFIYSYFIFKTKHRHLERLAVYFFYCLCLAYVQAYLTRTITLIVGLQWYLVVIAGIIFIFSFLSFLFFKLSIFKEQRRNLILD